MSHEIINQKLHAYHDQELSAVERAEVERHLDGCIGCRETLAQWKTISAVFFAASPVKAPSYFASRVMSRVREKQASLDSGRMPLWKWLAPAMALFAVNAYLFVNVYEPRVGEDPALASFTEGRDDVVSEFLAASMPVDDIDNELGWEEI